MCLSHTPLYVTEWFQLDLVVVNTPVLLKCRITQNLTISETHKCKTPFSTTAVGSATQAGGSAGSGGKVPHEKWNVKRLGLPDVLLPLPPMGQTQDGAVTLSSEYTRILSRSWIWAKTIQLQASPSFLGRTQTEIRSQKPPMRNKENKADPWTKASYPFLLF